MKSEEFPLIERVHQLIRAKMIPFSVDIELTPRCNLRCGHCYIPDKNADELSYEEIRSVIEQIAEQGTLFLCLTGGEIFVREDTIDIAEYARALKFKLLLLTNATLITPELADRIYNLNPAVVQVSLYGASESAHDGVTQVKGSHRRTINGIKLLIRRGIPVRVSLILMKQNVNEYKNMVSLVEGLHAGYQIGTRIYPKRNCSPEPLSYNMTNEQFAQINLQLGIGRPDSDVTQQLYANLDKIRVCGAGITGCSISSTGDVRGCNTFPKSSGNIKKQPFKEIWKYSEVFRELRFLTIASIPKCRKCNMIEYCSLCPSENLLTTGSLYIPAPQACAQAQLREISEKI